MSSRSCLIMSKIIQTQRSLVILVDSTNKFYVLGFTMVVSNTKPSRLPLDSLDIKIVHIVLRFSRRRDTVTVDSTVQFILGWSFLYSVTSSIDSLQSISVLSVFHIHPISLWCSPLRRGVLIFVPWIIEGIWTFPFLSLINGLSLSCPSPTSLDELFSTPQAAPFVRRVPLGLSLGSLCYGGGMRRGKNEEDYES